MVEFNPSSPGSIGVELELQLLDAETLDLSPGIVSLMEFFPDKGVVKSEFFQSCVEISSPVCPDTAHLRREFASILRRLRSSCSRLGMRLASAGTHAFCKRLALITPGQRYARMEEDLGYVGHGELIFGMHVHVGMQDGEQTIRVLRHLRPCLAMLLATSANSPLWRGQDTVFASYRHCIIGASRSYGIPPDYADWAAFEKHFDATRRSGMIESIKDIHWDIRPHPDLGTIEIRIMDAQSTMGELMAVAALVHALVTYFVRTPNGDIDPRIPQPLPWWADNDNCYRASRYGIDMPCIVDAAGNTRALRPQLKELLEILAPVSAELGETDDLERVNALLDKPGYAQQREVLEETGSAEAVARSLADGLDEEISALS